MTTVSDPLASLFILVSKRAACISDSSRSQVWASNKGPSVGIKLFSLLNCLFTGVLYTPSKVGS